MYELYKPFRNYLRGYNLWSGLRATYFYMQYLQFGKSLPNQLSTQKTRLGASKIDAGIFEFIVDTLSRELIVNAQMHGGKPFNTAIVVRKAFNMIHKLEDAKWGGGSSNSDVILQQLSRIAFRQVPWQSPITSAYIARYFDLYSHPQVAPMLQAEFGLTPIELFQVTMLLMEEMMHQPTPSFAFVSAATQSIHDPVKALSDRISLSATALREMALEHQCFDINWAYSFNPLREYPLIHAGNPRSTMCPAPPILIQRLTDGLYFDLIRADKHFGNAIGKAFEEYVARAAGLISDGHFQILPEARWGKPEKSSVDLILSDSSSSMFVECKLARLNIAAQTQISADSEFISAIERLAVNIGQLYSTLADGLAGQYPHWKSEGSPIHPIVVTFSNWFVFGPFFYKHLDTFVSAEFQRRGIDPSLLERYPFTVCSIDEFEGLLVACRGHSIDTVMSEKNEPSQRQSLMQGFLAERYPRFLKDLKETSKSGTEAIISGPSRLTGIKQTEPYVG